MSEHGVTGGDLARGSSRETMRERRREEEKAKAKEAGRLHLEKSSVSKVLVEEVAAIIDIKKALLDG